LDGPFRGEAVVHTNSLGSTALDEDRR